MSGSRRSCSARSSAQLRDGRLRVVPVARAVLVEVGRRRGEPPEGVPEDGRGLARQDAAEPDAAVLEPAVRGARRRRRAEVDRPRHPPAGRELAQVAHRAVDPQRQGLLPVDVLLDDRHPVVRQVARQLELHARVVDGDVRGQDQGVPVALLPQAVDDRRHQPQHAARALELHQRRPVAVEPVEHLGVDGIGRPDALLVVGVPALGRKLLVLRPVVVRERAGHDVPVLVLHLIGERLEQPSPDDLEALLGAGRPPRRFDPPDDVPQPVERLPPAARRRPPRRRPGRGASRTYPTPAS